MAKNLLTRGQFAARIQGLGRASVYRYCDGELAPALVEGMVDIDHPLAREFMGRHGYLDPNAPAPDPKTKKAPTRKPPPTAPSPLPEDDEDIETSAYLEMPLREVVRRFGTGARFKDYLGAHYKVVQIMGMEEAQARARGEYIHRTHADRLVAMIDGLAKALLTDATANMVNTATNLVKAGAERQEVERAVRDVISRTIKSVKSQAERAIRDV